MRQSKSEKEMTLNSLVEASHEGSGAQDSSEVSSFVVAYNEMADVPVQMIDPVEQIEKNLAHLQDLQARMKFMMREIRYLMKI